MKFESINRKYTEMVNEYVGRGYYFNAGTMSGSQGEIAHIDMTNGKEIVRILMETFISAENNWANGIRIVAGRCTDAVDVNTAGTFGNIIWNNRLEILEKVEFIQD